jgi:flagellar hook-basal body complex protein FliE
MQAIASIADISRAYPTAEVRPAGSALTSTPVPQGPSNVDFEGVLTEALSNVNNMSNHAGEQVRALAAGATDDLHGTMIAVKEAEIGMKLVGSVRNKLLDAFHELWRTSV